jgi:hypothetical protein
LLNPTYSQASAVMKYLLGWCTERYATAIVQTTPEAARG